jgi:hypothetical protein
MVIGRSRATSHEMLKTLATQIEDGDPPNLEGPDPFVLLGMRCHFIEVNTRYYSDYVGSPSGSIASDVSRYTRLSGPATTACTPGTPAHREHSRSGNPF